MLKTYTLKDLCSRAVITTMQYGADDNGEVNATAVLVLAINKLDSEYYDIEVTFDNSMKNVIKMSSLDSSNIDSIEGLNNFIKEMGIKFKNNSKSYEFGNLDMANGTTVITSIVSHLLGKTI